MHWWQSTRKNSITQSFSHIRLKGHPIQDDRGILKPYSRLFNSHARPFLDISPFLASFLFFQLSTLGIAVLETSPLRCRDCKPNFKPKVCKFPSADVALASINFSTRIRSSSARCLHEPMIIMGWSLARADTWIVAPFTCMSTLPWKPFATPFGHKLSRIPYSLQFPNNHKNRKSLFWPEMCGALIQSCKDGDRCRYWPQYTFPNFQAPIHWPILRYGDYAKSRSIAAALKPFAAKQDGKDLQANMLLYAIATSENEASRKARKPRNGLDCFPS